MLLWFIEYFFAAVFSLEIPLTTDNVKRVSLDN